ncbi:MAG TPA: hypothetical protein VMF11_15745 [Candidatus Baltobacteraceae bacterium]|nr:hypothetical protein [Candidatus Baltobacteraceae bacterium]
MRFIRQHFAATSAALVLTIGLCACGGGGGASSIPSTGGATQPSQGNGSADMVINIPPKSQTNTRLPAYISAGTQSITISLVSGSKTTLLATVNLTPGSSNCTTPAGGGLQCTVAVTAPFGTDTFSVSTYAQTGGAGSVLSTGEVQATLTLGQPVPSVTLELDGVPASVSLALGQSELPVGNAGSTAVIVQALDASGNLIIGPGLFSTPITLSITGDSYDTLKLSSSSVTSPGQVVTLSYNGGTNVGSTITPSGSGIAGTPATFAGSGGSLTLYQYYDSTNQVYGYEPEDVAAYPTGTTAVPTAAVLFDELYSSANESYYEGIGIASPSGMGTVFVGDTSDPFNPPAAGSLTIPGITVVHGMSADLNTETFHAYDDLAVNSSGTLIYYSGAFSTESDPSCDGEEESGTLGVLNPAAGTTTEYRLEGYPGTIRVDSSGRVWWIESTGSCGESTLLPGGNDYAIGELNGTTVTETTFSAAGLATNGYPADMSITANGSQMFIADEDDSIIEELPTATLSSPTTVTLKNSQYPYAIMTAPNDGTTAWFGGYDPMDNYFYGYVSGSNALSTFSEVAFPINYFYSYDLTYADGSFWAAGSDPATGIGRISGLSTGAPLNEYYAMPVTGEGDDDCDGFQELLGISAGSGYVVAVDDDCYNIDFFQYGAPSSGNVTYTSRRIGSAITRPAGKRVQRGYHAPDPRAARRHP